jgi:hypothetical protein
MGICRLTLVAIAFAPKKAPDQWHKHHRKEAPGARTTLEERVNSSRRGKGLGVTVDESCDLQAERQAFVM